jgi:hypothetical protein
MKCTDKTIKEMLPAYREQGLDQPEQTLVKDHLASCDDCRDELSLLHMMAEEAVPDPGEAVWAAMPGRIYREVQRQKTENTSSPLARFLDRMTLPRWAWASATIGTVLVVSWLMLRPVPVDLARTTAPDKETTLEYLEDMAPSEPMDVAKFSSTELAAATQWARNAFAPIREEVSEDAPENSEQDLSEDLSELSPLELERVYEMLKKKEQELRENQRNKTEDKKVAYNTMTLAYGTKRAGGAA